MKNLLLIAFLFAAFASFAQSPAKFKEVKHSFGKIKQNKAVSYVFTFTNQSGKPLVIESAVAGCGCTTPEYPKTPILKGKNGTVKVTYNAAAAGVFTKDVTVKFVDVQEPIVLKIDGEVLPATAADKAAMEDKPESAKKKG
jgi:opacity protein-like surface antigen